SLRQLAAPFAKLGQHPLSEIESLLQLNLSLAQRSHFVTQHRELGAEVSASTPRLEPAIGNPHRGERRRKHREEGYKRAEECESWHGTYGRLETCSRTAGASLTQAA